MDRPHPAIAAAPLAVGTAGGSIRPALPGVRFRSRLGLYAGRDGSDDRRSATARHGASRLHAQRDPHPHPGRARRSGDPGATRPRRPGSLGTAPLAPLPARLAATGPGCRRPVHVARILRPSPARSGSAQMAGRDGDRAVHKRRSAAVRSATGALGAVGREVPTRPERGAATTSPAAAPSPHRRAAHRRARPPDLLQSDAHQRVSSHRPPAAVPRLLAGPEHGRAAGDSGPARARPQLRLDADDRARSARHLRNAVDNPDRGPAGPNALAWVFEPVGTGATGKTALRIIGAR